MVLTDGQLIGWIGSIGGVILSVLKDKVLKFGGLAVLGVALFVYGGLAAGYESYVNSLTFVHWFAITSATMGASALVGGTWRQFMDMFAGKQNALGEKLKP